MFARNFYNLIIYNYFVLSLIITKRYHKIIKILFIEKAKYYLFIYRKISHITKIV